jgi:hypothetical protein
VSDLLKKYIFEVFSEMNARVPTQLLPKKTANSRRSEEKEEENEKEVDEMALAGGAIAGFTGPLGASSADMGSNPTKPGQKLKKHKKNVVRWK